MRALIWYERQGTRSGPGVRTRKRIAGFRAAPGYSGERHDEIVVQSDALVTFDVGLNPDQAKFERAIRLIVLIERKRSDPTPV